MLKIYLVFAFSFFALFSNETQNTKYKYTNELINSTSPYLQDHAHNPINWHIFSDKTLKKAKKQDKLIFLSIGYSTCHWCHVMKIESFENEKLSHKFNQNYINIKVDKEIQSDVDAYYQGIYFELFSKNGWPLNVIMTPNLEVLYMQTYIPVKYSFDVDGFDTLLDKFANIYKNDKNQLNKIIKKFTPNKSVDKNLANDKSDDYAKIYVDKMSQIYDEENKGFNLRPKFPLSSNMALLYDIYLLTNDKKAKKMFFDTLDAMQSSGLYDYIDGAFFRYSTDEQWSRPHFEKMLYTNAQLIYIYTKAYNHTKNKAYKDTINDTISQINSRYLHKNIYFSASDADTNHIEGAYFTYNYDEVYAKLQKQKLSSQNIEDILDYLNIGFISNFDDNSSHIYTSNDEPIPQNIDIAKMVLKNIRKIKTYPFIDKKIITSWNAMMIKSLFVASSINIKYKKDAIKSLDSLLQNLYIDDQLYHFKLEDKKIKTKAIFEDYSFLINTLLQAYQSTYDEKYLSLAKKFLKIALKKFYKNDTWYLSESAQNIKAGFDDKYYKSPLSLMLENIKTIAGFTYDFALNVQLKTMMKKYKSKILSNITRYPNAIKAIIREKYGDIIIKSSKQNLIKHKKQIQNINYPFVFTKAEDADIYLACDSNSCFANAKTMKNLISKIQKRIDTK